MSIQNARVTNLVSNAIRPTCDRLAQLIYWNDSIVQQCLDPEFLEPLGLTLAHITAEAMPSVEDVPDELIDDGRLTEGIPIPTRRKVLATLRVLVQFDALCKATQYGNPEYVKAVAYDLAVNPRG